MTKWEYSRGHIEVDDHSAMVRLFNEIGQVGWEVFEVKWAIDTRPDHKAFQGVYFAKRPLP